MPETKTPEQSVLEEITNKAKPVKAFGKTYQIRRFTLGQMADSLEYAGYIGVLLKEAMKLHSGSTPEEMVIFVSQGLAVSSPALIPLLSIAIQEPIEWLRDQDDAIGGLELFTEVVAANRGFFTRKNVQRVKEAFAKLMPPTPTPGGDTSTG